MVLCLFGEILVLFGLSALFMRKLAKTPPLALLQGDAARNRRERARKKALQAMVAESSPIPQFTLSFPISRELPKGGDYSPVKHVFRYVLRHMGRAGWRTVMAVLLAFLLTGAMGLLAVTRLSYQEIFDKTEVKGTLTNYSSSAVMEACRSELMNDVYYNGGFWVILNDRPVGAGYFLAVTNDIDRYIQSISTHTYAIEFAPGFDDSLFSKNVPQCVMGEMLGGTHFHRSHCTGADHHAVVKGSGHSESTAYHETALPMYPGHRADNPVHHRSRHSRHMSCDLRCWPVHKECGYAGSVRRTVYFELCSCRIHHCCSGDAAQGAGTAAGEGVKRLNRIECELFL